LYFIVDREGYYLATGKQYDASNMAIKKPCNPGGSIFSDHTWLRYYLKMKTRRVDCSSRGYSAVASA
jgi:hypothetical protein